MTGVVASVACAAGHDFSKPVVDRITLVEGLGVAGDAHAGVTVQHLSRVRRDPTSPNLRQVHLIGTELLDELAGRGFDVQPGDIGENVLTRGIDLLALPTGSRLELGADAVVEVKGLRNPCKQLNRFQDGLMRAVLDRGPGGELIRRCGVMGVVLRGGDVAPGDLIAVRLPEPPHVPLRAV